MKLWVLFLTGLSAHRQLRWFIRAGMSALVSLVLTFQPFFYLAPAQVKPPANPLAALTRPIETARYAASLFSPGLTLAQTNIITKTGPSTAKPGDFLSYPIVIYKNDLADWPIGTVVITDPVPANTGSPSGGLLSPWWSYETCGSDTCFKNVTLITGTGLITVGKFNVIVNSPLPNGLRGEPACHHHRAS
jgi:hypothetical protein